MTEFTKEQLETVRLFLTQVRERANFELEELGQACKSWARGGKQWNFSGLGAPDISTAIWWYQYRHKLGSKEWRPPYILRALIQASERDYVEPERLSVDERALKATPADRKRARKIFIEKHGVAAFYQRVKPILANRRGGVEALFLTPATPEIREYVAMLVGIVSGRANNNGGANGSRF